MTPPNAVLRLFVMLAVPIMAASCGLYPCSQGSAGQPKPAARLDPQAISITIDNVTVQVQSPFLPRTTFAVSGPGDANQAAASEGGDPFRYLQIVAVPFGTVPPSESDPDNPLPTAQAGGADAFRAKMREYKIAQGGNPQPGPTASLFGKRVTGDVSLLQLNLTTTDKPFMYVEWVAEAGPRLWIVRIVQQLPDGTKDLSGQSAFLRSLESLTLSSNNLDSPSTLKPAYGWEPGMPKTGAVSGWDYSLPALCVALLGGSALVGGLFLRRKGASGKTR